MEFSISTVRKFLERYPELGESENSIRWKIFNAEKNGLAKCGAVFRSPQGRVFINEDAWFRWLKRETTAGDVA